jgi:HEAT repeat protein
MRPLVERLADEYGRQAGSGRFQRYAQALEQRIEQLAGSEAASVLALSLARMLEDPSAAVRYQAAGALGRLGNASPEVASALLAALSDAGPSVRIQAAGALGRLGNASPAVVSALLAALRDADRFVRSQAAEALGQLENASPEVVSALLAALRDADHIVRSQAAEALGQLGNAASDLIVYLQEILHSDPRWSTRRDAARQLGRVGAGDQKAQDVLMCGLLDKYGGVRTACAEALAQLAYRFHDAAPAIEQQLLRAIQDPAFDPPDTLERRSGHDYAFHGLWMLVIGADPAQK